MRKVDISTRSQYTEYFEQRTSKSDDRLKRSKQPQRISYSKYDSERYNVLFVWKHLNTKSIKAYSQQISTFYGGLSWALIQYIFKLMSSSKGKPLTLELVFNKTKSDNLNNIKNLNLWGNQLEDLSIIQKMPNLQVISLSVNKIQSLRDFAKCSKLHQLYLRKNCISDLREIRYLLDLPYLKSLWLYDNPCAQHQNYREIVIHHLPNLTKLDNSVVTQQEKNNSADPRYEISFGQNNPSTVKESYYQNTPEVVKKSDVQSEVRRSRPQSEIHREEKVYNEVPMWKGNGNKEIPRNNYEHSEEQLNRNKNILIAVLSLMKELDAGSLEIVRKEAEKELRNR